MAFPTTPANGDTHTVGSITWSYNSTTDIWAQANTSGSGGGASPDQVVWPDWTSPNSTYTSSGTWSKGSLGDTDYVWIYMVNGGQGGSITNSPGYVQGGRGGQALLLYGQAQYFDGGTYVVGTGGAKGNNSDGIVGPGMGGKSTFTLSSSNGSTLYQADYAYSVSVSLSGAPDLHILVDGSQTTQTATQISAQFSPTSVFTFPQTITTESDGYTAPVPIYPTIPSVQVRPTDFAGPTGSFPIEWGNIQAERGYMDLAGNSVFGGGGGGGKHAGSGYTNAIHGGKSLYAGAGADYNTGNDGAVPGGGGGGGDNLNGSVTGNGGNGNIRVYHV
jgi:hypothetical protein